MSEQTDELILRYREDEGGVDRRRLVGILGASSTLLLLLLIALLALGLVGAVGVGIGGFVAEFGQVEADQGVILPALDEAGQCEQAPQIKASLEGEAQIHDHFTLRKDVPLPAVVDGVSAEIMSEPLGENMTADQLDLLLTDLHSESVVIGSANIYEGIATSEGEERTVEDLYTHFEDNITSDDLGGSPPTEFVFDVGGGIEINNGTAVVTQIAFDSIQLGTLSFSGELLNDDVEEEMMEFDFDCGEYAQLRRQPALGATAGVQGDVISGPTDVTRAGPPETEWDAQGVREVADGPSTGVLTTVISLSADYYDEHVLDHLPDGADYTVDIVGTTPPVSELEVGDTFVVEAEMSNDGDLDTPREVVMNIESAAGERAAVDSTTVALEPDETTTETFEYEVMPDDVPEITATVEVDEGGMG